MNIRTLVITVIVAMCASLNLHAASPRVVAYVTSWSQEIPDPLLVTNINYAFGHVSESFDSVKIDNPGRLQKIADLKRLYPDLEVQLSIGGWGSGRFSEMAADPKLRKAFAENCRRVMEKYNLDGIDIDWEYPTSNAAGISSSPEDTKNFSLLMCDLRKALPKGALLTLATISSAQFIDFKEIMQYVDFVNIMAYDMSTPPLHHSPLHASETCGKHSAETALRAHLDAGVPPEKLTLGMPFYGRGAAPYNNFVDYQDVTILPDCKEMWDEEACAPYIVDADGKLVLGFENEKSIRLKCDFIKENNLLGAMYWDYSGDNDHHDLAKAVADKILHE